jgi:lysophospholipase L1-like esterase
MLIRNLKQILLVAVMGVFFLLPHQAHALSINPLNTEQTKSDLTEELKRKPLLEIRIPGLTFSDVTSSTDEKGDTYFYIAWIPELITAVYKFSIAIFSIIAVIVIILQGFRIITSGGSSEGTSEGYKKIGHAVIGLFIAWGSFLILYTVNPKLVQFNPLSVKVINSIPIEGMEFDDKAPGYDESDAATSEQAETPTITDLSDLDKIFTSYAACYGLDPGILKSIAKAESGLHPYSGTGKKYQGLFQMDKAYCQGGLELGKYPKSLGLSCTNRIDPETNTAAAAATINSNIKDILKKCPNSDYQDVLLLLYVAHNNGPAVMHYAVDHDGCHGDDIRLMVRQFYDVQPGGQRRGVDADYGERKYKYGFKVVNFARSYGVTSVYPDNTNNSLCPRLTQKRVIVSNPDNANRRILAVGDSLTAAPNSHAIRLGQLTGISVARKVDGVDVAVSGQNTQDMYDEIKDKHLQSQGFTDLLIMGGVNDIASSNLDSITLANTVKTRLSRIYQKAKTEHLRIVALTITPFNNYENHWTSTKQAALEAVNQWIRSGADGSIDVVIDANQIIADPNDKTKVNHSLYGSNPIHFNAAGHQAIAEEEKRKAF